MNDGENNDIDVLNILKTDNSKAQDIVDTIIGQLFFGITPNNPIDNQVLRDVFGDILGTEITDQDVEDANIGATPVPEPVAEPVEEEAPIERAKAERAPAEEAPAEEAAVSYLPKGTSQLTLQELIDQYGVRPEDIQVVANEHPELATKISGGKTMNTLARSASKRGGRAKGYCARGTRQIYQASPDTTTIINDPFWTGRDNYRYEGNKQKYKGSDPGGDSFYRGLEQTGKFISIDVDNKAYGAKTVDYGPEDREMEAYLRTLPPGSTISFDCYTDRTQNKAHTRGGIWGHVCVMRNDGRPQCDGTQDNIDFARYGKQIHVSYPTDAYVPAGYAEMIIAQAKKRENDKSYTYPPEIRMRKGPWANKKNSPAKTKSTPTKTKSTPTQTTSRTPASGSKATTPAKPKSTGKKTKLGTLDKETKNIANNMPAFLLDEMKRLGLVPKDTKLQSSAKLMNLLSNLELTAEQKEALLAYTHDKKARQQELAAFMANKKTKSR